MVSLLQEQARTLSRYGMKKHLKVLPMYSGLSFAEQMKVFERTPPSVRKVRFIVTFELSLFDFSSFVPPKFVHVGR